MSLSDEEMDARLAILEKADKQMELVRNYLQGLDKYRMISPLMFAWFESIHDQWDMLHDTTIDEWYKEWKQDGRS